MWQNGCSGTGGPQLPVWDAAPITWVCVAASRPPTRLLSKILSECEDADEIEYLVDGSWRPIRPEKERSCSPQCSILVLGESGPPPACPFLPAPGQSSLALP